MQVANSLHTQTRSEAGRLPAGVRAGVQVWPGGCPIDFSFRTAILPPVKSRAYRRSVWLLVLAVALHWLPSFATGGAGFTPSLCTAQGIVPGDSGLEPAKPSADLKHGCVLCGGAALFTATLTLGVPTDQAPIRLGAAVPVPRRFHTAWDPMRARPPPA